MNREGEFQAASSEFLPPQAVTQSPGPLVQALRTRLEQRPWREIPMKRCPVRAAVAIVLTESSAGQPPHAAFIRRAENPRDPWSGQMSFPGGRADPADPDVWATAGREAREEVGLELTQALRLGRLDDLQAISAGRPLPLAISPVLFWLPDRPPLVGQPAEVAEALWIPLEHLRDGRRATTVPRTFEGRSYQLPGIDHEGRIIWGLTYRMLGALFAWLPAKTRPPGG